MKFNQMLEEVLSIYDTKEINFYCKISEESSAVIISFLFSNTVFILSKLTKNYSWVDRLWSILPTLYIFHFNFHKTICHNLVPHTRQLIMAFLSLLWSIRLTYNYYRKGGYSPGSEDYRWKVVEKSINNQFLMNVLNFVFIAYIQNYLLMLLAFPTTLAGKNIINGLDYVLIALYVIFLAIESIADEQQWKFQENKNSNKNDKKYKLGFIRDGLFLYSRHPNFFAEICLWWVIYLFSWNSYGFNYTCLGSILLTLLFQASTTLTEKISSSKYPEYKNYQTTTSRLIPMIPKIHKY